jgi:hypothetical protein
MKSRQRLMSVVVATLAVLVVPLSAQAKNHHNNYSGYSSAAAVNTRANSFTAFKAAPSTSSFFHQSAATNGFFAGRAARNAYFNSAAVNPAARYYGNAPARYYGAYNNGVTPMYTNYAAAPAYAAPVTPVYYGNSYAAPVAGYAAPVSGYAAPMTGYAAPYAYGGGGPCGNPYRAEKHEYNFSKLMNERQNLKNEIGQSNSYGNWSNAHRLNTQLEYVNEKLSQFHNTCGAASGYMAAPTSYMAAPAMMAAPTQYFGGNYGGYNGYGNYGGYNNYGQYGGSGLTSMLPMLGSFIR